MQATTNKVALLVLRKNMQEIKKLTEGSCVLHLLQWTWSGLPDVLSDVAECPGWLVTHKFCEVGSLSEPKARRRSLEPRGFEPLTSSMPLRRSTN